MNKTAMVGVLGMTMLLIFAVCSVSADDTITREGLPIIGWIAGCCIAGVILGVYSLYHIVLNGIRDRNMKDKVKEFEKAFKRARQYIHIQTDMNKEFFDDPKIVQAFKKVATKKDPVEIKILVDPEGEKLENTPRLKGLVDQGLLNVKIAKEPFRKTATPHCFVIDGRAVRIEDYHEPLNEDIRGIFWRNYPRLANDVETMFSKSWEAG